MCLSHRKLTLLLSLSPSRHRRYRRHHSPNAARVSSFMFGGAGKGSGLGFRVSRFEGYKTAAQSPPPPFSRPLPLSRARCCLGFRVCVVTSTRAPPHVTGRVWPLPSVTVSPARPPSLSYEVAGVRVWGRWRIERVGEAKENGGLGSGRANMSPFCVFIFFFFFYFISELSSINILLQPKISQTK